jgi:hypothetical protein
MLPQCFGHRAELTKRFVEVAEPNGRDYFVWGKRSYLIQYRAEGRTRRISSWVATRRHLPQQLAGTLAGFFAGYRAVQADDRAEERKALTMRQLCEAYLSATEKGLILGKRGLPKKASTLATDRGRIERHILPLLGNRKEAVRAPPPGHFELCGIRRRRASEPGTRR